MISVSHITKRFGAVAAVNDVSFSVEQGEVVGLLGPNGAGKTTTMRMMTGYYLPDEGEVTIGDVSVTKDPVRARREIGYLPESNPLYQDLLVQEYLTYLARVRNVAPATLRTAFDRVVADTGIGEVFYRPINELSKGYRQRVGLAGALIGDPQVLILDEPTEGLDPNQRTDMRTLLTRLAQEKTILISSHVISEVQAVADRFVVLKGGTVAGVGTVAELTRGQSHVRYEITLEGKGCEAAVRALRSVESCRVDAAQSPRVHLTVETADEELFLKEFSTLLHSGAYLVRRVAPAGGGLERVFAELTLDAGSESQ